jgi:heat shock protein HtpX
MQAQLPSLQRRAKLAVWLTYGFLLFLIVISVVVLSGFLYLRFTKIEYPDWLMGFAICALLLWILILFAARLPRDRFRKPGVLLTEEKQTRLFQEISNLTKLLDQPLPKKVYLTAEPNVYITYRGGFMGFGSRKVLGVGLPLFVLLNISELKAVLTHECGHYYAGDLKWAPWIYKTYEAILRILTTRSWTRTPKLFLLFARMFLRLTRQVCHHQEYAADALAARFVGPGSLVSGLQKIPLVVSANFNYNATEVDPLLHLEWKPPIAEGLKIFLNSSEGRKAAAAAAQKVDELLNLGLRTPLVEGYVTFLGSSKQRDKSAKAAARYDTHSPLQDRIAALAGMPGGEIPSHDSPALTLLEDVASLELAILKSLFPKFTSRSIQWQDVFPIAYLPAWRAELQKFPKVPQGLQGLLMGDLPDVVPDFKNISARFKLPGRLSFAEKEFGIENIIAKAITVVLEKQGAEIVHSIGEPLELCLAGQSIKPFSLVKDLRSGDITREEWQVLCHRAGIADLDLGQACRGDA